MHLREGGSPGRIAEWLGALESGELPAGSARWDVLSVLTDWIECNEPGVSPILAPVNPDDWRNDR
ncbi:hypothetical protein [Sphaerimonospora thailandensis]|uniref:Uncharacterized protein n=1 Tax=Sphaerimonospora thailandensis TaxID=795644 RepID=A0A8J3R9S7_9ACTN|nr:hypothetical protein [Sphaerimonospora thailandensis]GIH70386.1 hypothetical protein Mth01_26390 [Sphaerimonospora thailandensis]